MYGQSWGELHSYGQSRGVVGIVGLCRVELGKIGVRWVRWVELHPAGKGVANYQRIIAVH